MRFIEFMPLDAQGEWSRDKVVPAAEILERIDAVFPLEPAGDRRRRSPRRASSTGTASATSASSPASREPFCESCDRVRLTAEGQFRTCLFALEEFDLRAELRADGGLEATRPRRPPGGRDHGRGRPRSGPGHHIGAVDFVRPDRSMSQIGG